MKCLLTVPCSESYLIYWFWDYLLDSEIRYLLVNAYFCSVYHSCFSADILCGEYPSTACLSDSCGYPKAVRELSMAHHQNEHISL